MLLKSCLTPAPNEKVLSTDRGDAAALTDFTAAQFADRCRYKNIYLPNLGQSRNQK